MSLYLKPRLVTSDGPYSKISSDTVLVIGEEDARPETNPGLYLLEHSPCPLLNGSPEKELTYTGVTTHNQFQTKAAQAEKIPHTCGVIFPTGSHLPRLLNVRNPSGGEKTCRELGLQEIFPSGAYSARLSFIPFHNLGMPYVFRVFVSRHIFPTPVNKCVLAAFRLPWCGNIVVLRHEQDENIQDVEFRDMRRVSVPHVMFITAIWLRQMIGYGVFSPHVVLDVQDASNEFVAQAK